MPHCFVVISHAGSETKSSPRNANIYLTVVATQYVIGYFTAASYTRSNIHNYCCYVYSNSLVLYFTLAFISKTFPNWPSPISLM